MRSWKKQREGCKRDDFPKKALLDNGSNETLLLVIARGHAKQTASFMKGGEYDE